MKNKKFYSLLIAVIMILALALTGCGGGSSEESADEGSENAYGTTAPEDVSGDIRLSVWGSDAEIATDQEVIDAFMEEYPNVNVELEVINDDYLTKVETEMLAGDAPDVIYGHPKYFQKWAAQDQLLDLTPYFENSPELLDPEVYATDLYDAFTYQGKYISTVNGADTTLIFYNKDLFDEAGVPYPAENWTMEDFLDACEKLTVDKDGDGVIDQYAFSGGFSHDGLETFMAAYGATIYDDFNNPTKVTVADNPGVKEGIQMVYDLYNKYHYAPNSAESEAMQGGFDQGFVAMDLGGVYNIVYRSAVDGGLEFPYGLAEVPQVGDGAHATALMAGYCIPKTTRNPEAAWALAKFMESERGQTILAKTGLITVIRKDVASSDAVIDIPNAPDNHLLRVTTLDGATNLDAKLPNWQETLDTVWYPTQDKLQNGDITVDEAIAEWQAGLEAALAEAASN